MFGVKKNAGAPSGSNGLMERRIPATNGVQTPQPFSQQPQSGFAETDGETPAKTEREQAIAKINRFGVDIRGAFEEYISGQQDMVNSVIEAVVSGAHFCAIGPYGIGKSYIPRVLYKLLGVDGRTVAMHPETTHADVNGFVSLDPRTGQKITNPSPFFESLVVLVDEVNRSGERGQSSLLPILNDGEIIIGNDTKTTREVETALTVIATMNPAGEAGTRLLLPALAGPVRLLRPPLASERGRD